MAEQGATAEEILKHYFSGIEVRRAESVPRSEQRRSLVLGQVVDGDGKPRGGLRLLLRGGTGRFDRGTTRGGRFWFSSLPAGRWELLVRGKPVRYSELETDGRNTLEIEVVVPDAPPLVVRSLPMAYPRQLLGTLGYKGVPVTVVDSAGERTTILSGSAPDFDPGGFAIPLPPPGTCTISFLDQSFDLEIGDTGLWVRFLPGVE